MTKVSHHNISKGLYGTVMCITVSRFLTNLAAKLYKYKLLIIILVIIHVQKKINE